MIDFVKSLLAINYQEADIDHALKISKILKKTTNLYDQGNPVIDDELWDEMYFWIKNWQEYHHMVINNACSNVIYFETVSQLNKVEHNHPMLSLDKTKDRNEIEQFCKKATSIGMLKMDGLTCSLTYKDGKLIRAETRGNGYVGEDITHNALVVKNIPQIIEYRGSLSVDGEIICTYKDFEPYSNEYKNPRNFAAGSIRLLNSEESYSRHLSFIAWDAIGEKFTESYSDLSSKFVKLFQLGFTVVPWLFVTNELDSNIEVLTDIAQNLSYPFDGLVFKYDSCSYYESLGSTTHHFKGGLALKLYDETYETVLRDIDWTLSRNGTLTPVAIFDEVQTENSVVTRANLHNISIMEELCDKPWCAGMKLEIFLANMIIPQVKSAVLPDSPTNKLEPPSTCPVCGGRTEICQINESKELICSNPECKGKFINILEHFCSIKGMDIKGLSKATLEKLIEWGWIEKLSDIYNLTQYKNIWINQSGFGEKSVEKILAAIEASKNCTLNAFISALGIPLIGQTMAKELIKHISTYEDFRNKIKEKFDFGQYDNFSIMKTSSLWNFDYSEADKIYQYLNIKPIGEKAENKELPLKDKVFVITGKTHIFKNRDALKAKIEECGGRVSTTISGKTAYLINNDINSTSSKNLKAKSLNIPIISEDQFMSLI